MPNLLDLYENYVTKTCNELKQDSLSDNVGSLGEVLNWLSNAMQGGIFADLANSPMGKLAQDWVAQQIAQNASSLIMAATDNIKGSISGKIMAVQNFAFSAVTAALMFQYELIFYMAKEGAKKISKRAADNIELLKKMQDAVQQLYNALIKLSNSSPFFDAYLKDLRAAIILINDAQSNMYRLRSAFKARTFWSKYHYNKALDSLDRAIKLILPPPPATPDSPLAGPDGPVAKDDLSNNTAIKASTKAGGGNKVDWVPANLGVSDISKSDAYQAYIEIPQLAMGVIESYNNYITMVFKLNAGIALFQGALSSVQQFSWQEGLENYLKQFVTEAIGLCRNMTLGVMKSMALDINNGEQNVAGPEPARYRPNSVTTSAKAPIWGVKLMAVLEMLKLISTDSLSALNNKSELLDAYNNAIDQLAALDNRKTQYAFMRCTDAKEALGDIEVDILTLAFQAIFALGDAGQLGETSELVNVTNAEGETSQFDAGSAIVSARRVYDRLGLSIVNCENIIRIMDQYVARTTPLLGSLNALGNSISNVLAEYGYDKALEDFQSGNIASLLSMDSKTATYAGVAMLALNQILNAVEGDEAKKCVSNAISDLQSSQTASKLQGETASSNVADQKLINQEKCKQLQDGMSLLGGCAGPAGETELDDETAKGLSQPPGFAPTLKKSITSVISGILGGPSVPLTKPVDPGNSVSPSGGDAIVAETDEPLGASSLDELADIENNPGENSAP